MTRRWESFWTDVRWREDVPYPDVLRTKLTRMSVLWGISFCRRNCSIRSVVYQAENPFWKKWKTGILTWKIVLKVWKNTMIFWKGAPIPESTSWRQWKSFWRSPCCMCRKNMWRTWRSCQNVCRSINVLTNKRRIPQCLRLRPWKIVIRPKPYWRRWGFTTHRVKRWFLSGFPEMWNGACLFLTVRTWRGWLFGCGRNPYGRRFPLPGRISDRKAGKRNGGNGGGMMRRWYISLSGRIIFIFMPLRRRGCLPDFRFPGGSNRIWRRCTCLQS